MSGHSSQRSGTQLPLNQPRIAYRHTLDGTDSLDPEGDPINFVWALVTQRAGSAATLQNPYTAHPTFAIDVNGIYAVPLVVNDGALFSAIDLMHVQPWLVVTVNSVGAVCPNSCRQSSSWSCGMLRSSIRAALVHLLDRQNDRI
jgi:hypothetical protein